MGHCRASLIKPKQMREIIEPRASRTIRARAAGGLLNLAAVESLGPVFQARSQAHVKAWRSARNQALDVPRTLAMVVAVMASRSEAR